MTALLILIVAFFPVGILLRKMFPHLCALCFAAFGTWLIGLVYVALNGAEALGINSVSLGILMGGSAVGSMYYLFSKLSEEKQLFKLPYLITAFALVYAVLMREVVVEIAIGVGIVWLAFFALHGSRNVVAFKKGIQQIIECCKNW